MVIVGVAIIIITIIIISVIIIIIGFDGTQGSQCSRDSGAKASAGSTEEAGGVGVGSGGVKVVVCEGVDDAGVELEVAGAPGVLATVHDGGEVVGGDEEVVQRLGEGRARQEEAPDQHGQVGAVGCGQRLGVVWPMVAGSGGADHPGPEPVP